MKVAIPKDYDEILGQNIQLDFSRRRQFYVYLDYTSDGKTYYYVGKGSGNRIFVEKRNDIHEHYKNQRGLDRRVVLQNLTEEEALGIENLFWYYSLDKGIYVTNKIINNYFFYNDYTFDDILTSYIEYLEFTSFSSEWINELANTLNKFKHLNIITILIEAYLNINKRKSCITNETATLIKDSIKNSNLLSRLFLNSIISEIDDQLTAEEFDDFLNESMDIAESLETNQDIILQRDRCISKLQDNLPCILG